MTIAPPPAKPIQPAVAPPAAMPEAKQPSPSDAGQTPAARTQLGPGHDRKLGEVYGPLGFLKELFVRYEADQCGSWAASLSFFALLSVAPVLLCALAVLGFVIQNPAEAAHQVEKIIASLLPGSAVQQTAHELVAQMNIEQSAETLMASRGVAGIVGVVSLFWAALQIFVNAVPPMNAAFRAKETRTFVKLRTTSLALLFGAGTLFLLSLLPTIAGQYIMARVGNLGGQNNTEFIAPAVATLLVVVSIAVSVLVNSVMFAVIYRYLPSPAAGVSWREAAFGGTIAAVLWEIAKRAFSLYLANFANYNKMYGSLGGLVGLIFWIYYSSMILLLGAEIAGLYSDYRARRARGRIAAAAKPA